jgi:hypothetical protein
MKSQNRDLNGMTPHDPNGMTPRDPQINYVVDPEAVAEAIVNRVIEFAGERVQHRRSLIDSVEVLVPGDYNGPTLPV